MRLSTSVPVAIAVAPLLASAAGTLGFAVGDKNPDGTCKGQTDWEDDMAAISSNTGSNIVRIYAASECNTAQYILPAAKNKGFKVVLGLWPDTDASYSADKAAVVKYAPQYSDQVYAITVGSETLYRASFTGPQLLAKIKDVKSALPQFKVGTADSWNKYADGTADAVVQGGADILLCNAFSYWQGQDINNATASFYDDIMQSFGHIQSLNPNAEVWVGETGWTTNSSTYGSAVPSVDNANKFYSQGVCGILAWGYNVFFFEAFDEPGKPPSVGQNGQSADETHWGAMTSDRKTKYSLKC